jgi:hypothetical protein
MSEGKESTTKEGAKMKWSKETQAYMWAHYYSEDGNWKAWDEDRTVKGGGRGTVYNPELKRFVQKDAVKHIWLLQNLVTGDVVDKEFKTLKAAKQYAEEQ